MHGMSFFEVNVLALGIYWCYEINAVSSILKVIEEQCMNVGLRNYYLFGEYLFVFGRIWLMLSVEFSFKERIQTTLSEEFSFRNYEYVWETLRNL